MLKNDDVCLRHILDAAREAIAFSSNRSREDLNRDRMLNLSLVRLLEVIGEAARGISLSFLTGHPEIPWEKMVGMRDRLIHGYFDINLDVVWETVTEDLPPLIDQLEGILTLESGKLS
jgi:uncharacterized protein with HEPN domain